MPVITCRACGYKTNTALSYHINSEDEKADYCYARLENNNWAKGCQYNRTVCKYHQDLKDYIDKLIGGGGQTVTPKLPFN